MSSSSSAINHGKGKYEARDSTSGKGKGKGAAAKAKDVDEGRGEGLSLTRIALARVDCQPDPSPGSDERGEGELHFPLLDDRGSHYPPGKAKGEVKGGAAEGVDESREEGLSLTRIALARVDCPPDPRPGSDERGEGDFHIPLLDDRGPHYPPMCAHFAARIVQTHVDCPLGDEDGVDFYFPLLDE